MIQNIVNKAILKYNTLRFNFHSSTFGYDMNEVISLDTTEKFKNIDFTVYYDRALKHGKRAIEIAKLLPSADTSALENNIHMLETQYNPLSPERQKRFTMRTTGYSLEIAK